MCKKGFEMNEIKKSNYQYLQDCKDGVLKYSALFLFGIWSMVFVNTAFASNIANNERERVTPAQNLSSYKSLNYKSYKATSVIADNDSAYTKAVCHTEGVARSISKIKQ